MKEAFDEVIVSLDGPRPIHDRIRHTPGAFDALARGVTAIQGVATGARCVVQRLNHDQLVATAELAEAWGLGSISFLAADLTSTAFGRTKELPILWRNRLAIGAEQLPMLEGQIEQLRTRWIVRDSPGHLRRIVDLFRAHLG